MTESNGSTLQNPDPDEPSIGVGTMLQTARPGPQEPPGTRGRTAIADGVVEKIAGIAAREVPGIDALGGGFTRSMGAVRDRVPGGHASAGRGVKVEVGEKQTAIDLQVVVEYGVSITVVAAEVRENVIAAVERMTGLEVVEVNIAVNDVRLPDEDTPQPSEDRVL
ncbi:Asp23/Gls24 family envelope stress response protein [Streptomyces sp. V4I2]|uniref:Asp23/Gls24 family envelope stress response protein n=1 Tax=Streptomyces sp. V4I2 TaxID=3042280 RepID=UPI002783CBDD|nr:putative alkaline shock family protein YloU [Streptomyces sp. V4I2]